jgi:DNA-binding SARP family transcriptional activator
MGLGPTTKWWLRRLATASSIREAIERVGPATVVGLAELDPEGWRHALVESLALLSTTQRAPLIVALGRIANRELTTSLDGVPGQDVARLRERLVQAQAPRLYVRTFGRLAVHRGSWLGPEVPIEKRRLRTLVGFLAAHSRTAPTRDAVIDRLWPEADGDSAINNLNQSVFQLRRALDPDFRAGTSPEYLISTAEHVRLNPGLVRVDLMEVDRLGVGLGQLDWEGRNGAAVRMLDLVQGDFLPEFRYEDWMGPSHIAVTMRLRELLLPIASGASGAFDLAVRLRASEALLRIDPFDEAALLSFVAAMEGTGKRIAARDVILAYAERLKAELDDEPSEALQSAIARLDRRAESFST